MQMTGSARAEIDDDGRLDRILSDIRTIIDEDKIEPKEIGELGLESEEVDNFLKDILNKSSPEQALRDELLAGQALLGQLLFGEKMPETSINKRSSDTVGKIDYELRGDSVLVELKPLFHRYESGGSVELRQTGLDWEDHREQIQDYLHDEYEYLVFTNLKDTYIFSHRDKGPANDEPLSFDDYVDIINANNGDLYQALKRFTSRADKRELDEEFIDSLERWVSYLEEVEFTDSDVKTERIINFINKFIFIRTLDDYSVIDHAWIENRWNRFDDDWPEGHEDKVLDEFLTYVNRWFDTRYGTELFDKDDTLFDYVDQEDDDNIKLFYRRVKLVLGVEDWQDKTTNDGITGYRYDDIDEDIYGKAYETFLADRRNEEGIYYTPRYITEYIVTTRVGEKFDQCIDEFESALEDDDLDAAYDAIVRMTQLRVMDPAHGSGSFLIKSLRNIWDKYQDVIDRLEEAHTAIKDDEKQSRNSDGSQAQLGELGGDKLKRINEMKRLVHEGNDRARLNQIIVRHIHGNDLDEDVLSIVSTNIFKEMVKVAPGEFDPDKILKEGDGYSLPELNMNFGQGDTLLGFPDDEAVRLILDDHEDDLEELFELRERYLENPENEDLVSQIDEKVTKLNKNLDDVFEDYLENEGFSTDVLDESDPMHLPVDFWYVYFNEDLTPRSDPGWDVIVGNPPYERIQAMRDIKPAYVEYLNDRDSYTTTFGNYDIAVPFTERGYQMLAADGYFGYILTKKWMTGDYGEKLRELLSSDCAVTELIDFGSEQVFDDPSTYTAILSLTNSPQDEFRYAQVTELKKDGSQLDDIHNTDDQRVEDDYYVTIEDCDNLDSDYWAFGTADEEEILDKLEDYDTLEDESNAIFVGLQTSADPVYIVEVLEDRGETLKVYSKHKDDEYIIEKSITEPILRGAEIERWAIRGHDYVLIFPYNITSGDAHLISQDVLQDDYHRTWDYLTDCKTKLKDKRSNVDEDQWWEFPYKKNLEDFDQPKIITQVNANYASFALDEDGTYYFVGGGTAGGYGVSFDADETALRKRVLGLLNSYLLDWRVKHASSEFRGEFFSFAQRYMEDLPIAEPEDEKSFNETVTTLVDLATARYQLESLWDRHKSIANNEETLTQLLETHQEKRRYGSIGAGDDTWFDDVSFYPDDDEDTLTEVYDDFTFEGDADSNTLYIYGVRGESEDRIYEIAFPTTEHLNIVYLAVKDLFDTRKKVETLQHLLDKTEVPVITPNSAKNTPNIMEEMVDDFDDWLQDADLDTPVDPDVVVLENREQDLFIDLNVQVFDMYDITADEAMTIMNKTKIRHRERDQVLDRL